MQSYNFYRINKLLVIIFIIISLPSCGNDEYDNIVNNQEKTINELVKAKIKENPDWKYVYNKNSHRIIVKEGDGNPMTKNGTVDFYYDIYILDGNEINSRNIVATNRIAADTDSTRKKSPAFRLNLLNDNVIPGLRNGLEGVKSGEECYILCSNRQAFSQKEIGAIPKTAGLIYHLWIENIIE